MGQVRGGGDAGMDGLISILPPFVAFLTTSSIANNESQRGSQQ